MAANFPPATGAGSASDGFALGTSNNVFANTGSTGDGIDSVSSLTIAPDLTTAEATRDTYSSENSGWIDGYTDLNVNIILYYLNGADKYTQYQRRVGNSWVNNGNPIIALQGETGRDGISSRFNSRQALDDYFIANPEDLRADDPVVVNIGNNVIADLVWIGPDNPPDYAQNDARWKIAAARFSNNSVFIGSTRQSNVVEGLQITTADSKTYLSVLSEYDGSGSSKPVYYKLDSPQTLNVNLVDTEDLPSTFEIQYSTFGDNFTLDTEIIPSTTGNLRVQYWLGSDDTGKVIFDETRPVTQEEVDAGQFVSFGVGNPYLLDQGTQIFVRFSGVQLKGGEVTDTESPFFGQTVIAFKSTVMPFDRKSVAIGDEVFSSASRSSGYIELSRDGGDNDRVSVSDFERVYRNLGSGATPGNSISIDLIESTWIDCHPDCGGVSRVYLPSNSNLDSDEQFVIDFTRVTSDISFDIETPDTVFRDGTTSATIKAGHMFYAWAHIDNVAQPRSSSNPVRVYFAQLAAHGDMGPIFHPEFERTIIASQNGDDTLDGKTLPRAVETISRARALQSGETGYKQTLCLDASSFNESSAIILATGEDLILPFAEYTGDLSGPISGHCNVELYKHFGLLGVGSEDHFYIREYSGGVTVQGESHNNTKLVIDNFQSGGISVISSATGTLYLEINNVHSGFTLPSFPSGLKVIGRIGDQYLGLPSVDSGENTFTLDTSLSENGDGSISSPYNSVSSAMSAARSVATGSHKAIKAIGVRSLGDFVNTASDGNVTNLIFDAVDSKFDGVALSDHATTIKCRVIGGDASIGDQCEIDTQSFTHSTSSTISFTSEVHSNTKIRAKRVESTVAISFANCSSGSYVICEIDNYEGNIDTALDTIPTGVTVIGWIGSINLPLATNTKTITLSTIEQKEYPIVISASGKGRVIESSIWHSEDSGQVSVDFKKNGTSQFTQSTTDSNAVIVNRGVDFSSGDNFTADVTSINSVSGPVTIELKIEIR